jgi:putative transposase
MKKLQAFKFEIKPNGEQHRKMLRFAGSSRFVFNKALALQKSLHDDGQKKLSYAGMCKELTFWKDEISWLSETHSQVLQQSLKNLETAYQNFFDKRAAFPQFKKKGMSDSFRFPQGFKLDQANSRIYLPKLGWIKYLNSRNVLGTPKNITISLKSGQWYASIQTEHEIENPIHLATSIVGIDVGITRFATLSDGSHIDPLNSFKKHQNNLAKYQRRMSRKVKFSQNWKKAKAKVTKIHTRIANARADFLHKTTTTISKNHAVICIEDLRIDNMSKSASGNVEKPGRSVKAKSGLNRSILDQGWGEFRRQLEYKQAWAGGEVIAVNPRNTSRTCPCCSHVSKENRKTQSKFLCVSCGYENHADYVGALNICAAGHAVIACGGMMQSDHPVKQEPTEVIQAFAA